MERAKAEHTNQPVTPRPALWLPFTIAFLAVQILANWAAGTFGGSLPHPALMQWGISGIAVDQGEFERFLTSTFLSHDIGMFFRQFLFAACVIGLFEYWFGTLRAVLTFFSIDTLGVFLVLLLVAGPINHFQNFANIDTNMLHDVGMSAGGFGLIGALVASIRGRWIWILCGLGLLGAKVVFDLDLIADMAHAISFVMGSGAHILLRPQRRTGLQSPA